MLIPVTVMSHVFNMLKDVPDGIPAVAAPLSAFATVLVIAGSVLKGTGVLRLWAPVIGVVAGSAVAGIFGLYDIARVIEASWIGLPQGAWPGFDLDFGPVFWTLLPAFVFVALIDTMQTISASVAIQQVSWRQPRTVDFRAVQGAVAAAGVAKLLAGLSGTVPNTTYSTTVSVTELTGVGARRLLLVAYKEDGGAVLEFVASTGEENLQDRIALLGARIDEALGRTGSFTAVVTAPCVLGSPPAIPWHGYRDHQGGNPMTDSQRPDVPNVNDPCATV